MAARNQTAAVIGAGDFIGAAIAKRLAAEGFSLFVGRRNGDKFAPLIKEIETSGGSVVGRSLDARKEDEIVSFLSDADKQAPLEICVFNIGANVNFPLVDTTERVFRKVWEMACYSGFLGAKQPGSCCSTAEAASSLPGLPRAYAVVSGMLLLPVRSLAFGPWRKRQHANCGQRTSMLRI